jgi:hypothetical protein
MNEIKLSLTADEARVLVQLLDVAVRARGLEVAGAALDLFNKVAQVAKTEETPWTSQ